MTAAKPAWWSKQHDSAWDHVKEALRRDWEQTKSDYSHDGSATISVRRPAMDP